MKRFLPIFLFVVFISTQSFAAGFEAKAETHVKSLVNEGISIIAQDEVDMSVKKKEFYTLLNKYFDIPTISRFVLGRYWKNVDDSQKQEYVDLFETMIVEIYSNRFEGYTDEEVEIVSSRSVNDRDVIVSSRLIFKDKRAPLPLEWRVRNQNGNPQVIDLVVEGVSMSVTQRSDFNSVLKNSDGDIDVLLEKMREKYTVAEK